MDLIAKLAVDEKGASSVEYTLLVMFIALTVIVAVKSLGEAVWGSFDSVNQKLPN
jgi:Flp pilus assembly pilin Flp